MNCGARESRIIIKNWLIYYLLDGLLRKIKNWYLVYEDGEFEEKEGRGAPTHSPRANLASSRKPMTFPFSLTTVKFCGLSQPRETGIPTRGRHALTMERRPLSQLFA